MSETVDMYLRKSRSDPDDESMTETLARHKKTLLESAHKNNLLVRKIYEEVVSGDGLFVRPEMMKLLADIESGDIDGVLCMDIDRLGRVNTKDRGIILDTFKDNNVKIYTPSRTFDLTDEIDEFTTEMQMLLARQELKKITKRMNMGVRRTLTDGGHVTEPPFGYRRTYIGKKPTLEIYEPEATIIRRVFDMYVNEGIGSYTIAAILNSEGLTPRKSDHFSRNTIRFYLQNEVYIGKVIWNKNHRRKKKLPTDKNVYDRNPIEQWIIAENSHPAIITKEQFAKAQEIRLTRTHPPCNNGVIRNPFAGVLKCSVCGHNLMRQTSKKTGPRVYCADNGCVQSTVVSAVEALVLDSLESTLTFWKTNLVSTAKNEQTEQQNAIQSYITAAKKQLTTLYGQSDNLHNLLEQGVYDIETFTTRSALLADRIAATKKQLAEYNKRLLSIRRPITPAELLPVVEYLLRNYDSMSAADKNAMYKQIFTSIDYSRDKTPRAEINLKLHFREWI